MNKFLVVLAFLGVIQIGKTQDYRFGKVSEDELLEISNPNDGEANATVLYRNQYIHFDYIQNTGFVQKNEIHERIKIYNKDGFDQATKIIELYNESNSMEQSLTGLKAYTYNLESGKIVQDKLKKDGIFDEETNKYWKTKKFTMPNIKEGSVIEYKYTIQSPYLRIEDVDFQQEIPIKKLDFKLITPEYYNYKIHVNPKAVIYPKLVESTKTSKINFSSSSRKFQGDTFGSHVSTTYNRSSVDMKENIVESSLDNIPALREEPMVSNIENYKSQVRFELNYIKYPNEPVESLATSWEKVSKSIFDDEDFGGQLKKYGYFEDDLSTLLNGITDNLQKTSVIFNFVKTKVKWNGFSGYYTDNGVRKAYKDGEGNVADINLMLISMLNYAGLEADPVLVSTKDNGIPLFPTRRGFNYVICKVQLDEKFILLDATEKFSTANTLPLKALNWQGRLIRKDGTSNWVELVPRNPSKEIVSLNIKIDQDLSTSGKIRDQFTDYQAFRYRNRFENFTTEEIIETIQDESEIEISNLEIKNQDDLSKPITLTYEYSIHDAIEQIGDKFYFTPLLFLASDENPFKEDSRKYPIDFVYPIADRYIVNVMIPEGYIVDALPENTKTQVNGTDSEFTYLVRQNGNMLQLRMSLDLNKTLIQPSDYEIFKHFYQLMIDKQSEKVVLKKSI